MSAGRSDVLDRARAAKFAWRFVRAGEKFEERVEAATGAVAESPQPEPRDVSVDAESAAIFHDRAAEKCAELARAIDAAWRTQDVDEQRTLTRRLARKAAALGIELVAMVNHVRLGIRLARLFARHAPKLGAAARRDATLACIFLSYDEVAELADLVVDLVLSGDADLSAAVREALDDGPPDFSRTHLAPLLAELATAESSAWAVRALAVEWLVTVCPGACVPTLVRALEWPNVAIRATAIEALLSLDAPELDADRVYEQLADVVLNPPDLDEHGEELYAAIGEAIAKRRPEHGAELLASLVSDEAPAPEWALLALASAYPARAVAVIDGLLASAVTRDRERAVHAIEPLPRELGGASLERAAADGAPSVARAARELYLAREGRSLRLDDLAGLPTRVLREPPSDRMRARVLALRAAADDEAREAMLRVLLRDAPDPEAVAVLVFVLQDDRVVATRRRGLPADRRAWCRTIVRRFGAAGIDALGWLLEQRPGPERASWFEDVAAVLASRGARKQDARPLWTAAIARLLTLEGAADRAAQSVAKLAGDPAETARALWPAASTGATSSFALDIVRDDPRATAVLEELAATSLAATLAAEDWDGFARVVRLAPRRGACLDVMTRALSRVDGAPSDAMRMCASALASAGRLEDAWVEDALDRPESPRFAVAASVAQTPRAREKLERALSAAASHGAAAVEAARALLSWDDRPIAKNDPRLLDAIDAAPPPLAVTLVVTLLARSARFAPLARRVEALLTADDDATVDALLVCDLVFWLRRRRAFLRGVLPSVRRDEIRDEIEAQLGDDASFWKR